ncbi:MAG TPA: PilZ domain-containing protein [Vicinamibacterales bacterium]|nr:PilZ domain-containing protein [Vicinamibacterales bacterium]
MIIASADRLQQIKGRVGPVDGETLDFTDVDALTALETIIKRRPQLVALERLFAATPRGAALINRIKVDKKLTKSEIKVFAHDSDFTRVIPRPSEPLPQSIDHRGTRRAPRFKMTASATAVVEGKTSMIIDLSTIGAQVVSPGAIKPNQTVSMQLLDKGANVRFSAKVAWTSFEIPPNSGPRYRAGVEFVDADPVDVDGFIERHRIAG